MNRMLGCWRSRSFSSGSVSTTSRPAAAMWPESRASQERSLVDQRAAGRVDQHGSRPHPGDGPCVDHVPVRRIEITVQAHEMALLEQVFELINAADPQRLVHPLAQVGVVKDDVEPQRLGSQGGRRPDPAAADHAEGLAAQPRSTSGAAIIPGSRPDRLVRRHQPAHDRQQEHDRMIGDFLGAVIGNVADDHAVPRRGLDVDVVIARPRPGPRTGSAGRAKSSASPTIEIS